MKLRNKKTGEIVEICKVCPEPYEARDFICNSLVELNENWEDYKELEEPQIYYWYIDDLSIVSIDRVESSTIVMRKNFGNHFDTREEAEQAVEKLKAWKRLKDNGFKFSKWFTRVEGGIQINMKYPKYDGIHAEDRADLDLLFGGEE